MKMLKLLPLFFIANVYSIGELDKKREEPSIYNITKLHPNTFSIDEKNYPIINGFRLILYERQRDKSNPTIFSGIKSGEGCFKTLENGNIRFKLKKISENAQIFLIDPEVLNCHNEESFLVIEKEK